MVAEQQPAGEAPCRASVTSPGSAAIRPLLQSFPEGVVFTFDRDLRFVAAGGQGLADAGLHGERLEGRTIHDVFPVDTVEAVEHLYRVALEGTATTSDVAFKGRVYVQHLTGLTDPAGAVVGGLGFLRDVTDERARKRAQEDSALQNRLTFEHAPIGKAIVALDGTWLRVNAALCELTGYSEEQLLRRTFQDITHPDDLDLDLAHLHRLVEGDIRSYRIEKRYLTASGEIVWILLSVALARGPDGDPLYFISQVVDVTESKRQYQALQDLTAMVAHDLRTPASVIRGFAELLEGSAASDPRLVRDYAARISASAQAMMALSENALTDTTLGVGHLVTHPAAVALRGAVEGAVQAADLGSTAVDTEAVVDLAVCVDPVHLSQILTNLLTNAAKYGDGQVVVSSCAREDRVLVSVADDGRGVEPDFVPRLFERFSRSDATRAGRQRGSGLGLHIVLDLLTANDGRIEYRRSRAGGAEFSFDLPAALPHPSSDP